jgi:hypothetical protein
MDARSDPRTAARFLACDTSSVVAAVGIDNGAGNENLLRFMHLSNQVRDYIADAGLKFKLRSTLVQALLAYVWKRHEEGDSDSVASILGMLDEITKA